MHINSDFNIFRKLKDKSNLTFDYEVNRASLIEDENGKIDRVRLYGKSVYTHYSKNFKNLF